MLRTVVEVQNPIPSKISRVVEVQNPTPSKISRVCGPGSLLVWRRGSILLPLVARRHGEGLPAQMSPWSSDQDLKLR
ncbi:hypothetical protein AVEN_238038-1, partial [Araneus ventricosus]